MSARPGYLERADSCGRRARGTREREAAEQLPGQLALLTALCAPYWPLVLSDLGSSLALFARQLATTGLE